MSRIGRKPVDIPRGVDVQVADGKVTVKGGSGTLSIDHRPEVRVKVEGGQVVVERLDEQRKTRAFHGMTRSLIQNMVQGVSEGFTKELEVVGVGWGVRMEGQAVALNVGYADTRKVAVPSGVKVEIAQNRIKISGPDKQQVGQLAADIRRQRKPEPYNGKGIKYADERIVRKQGKAVGG